MTQPSTLPIFDERGRMTQAYLASRGACCGNGCYACPYEPRHQGDGNRTLRGDVRVPRAHSELERAVENVSILE